MICRRAFAASLGLAAMLASSHAFAGVIVQNIAGTLGSGSGFFFGQSFTTPSSGGPWDDITFNFFPTFWQQLLPLLAPPFSLTQSTWEHHPI